MWIASVVMITLSVLTTAAGLPCCLGCVNYVAVPVSLATAAVGLVGLGTDKDPATARGRNVGLHLAAVIVGVLCAVIGALRCAAGGGCC